MLASPTRRSKSPNAAEEDDGETSDDNNSCKQCNLKRSNAMPRRKVIRGNVMESQPLLIRNNQINAINELSKMNSAEKQVLLIKTNNDQDVATRRSVRWYNI